jgi:hypothetical protein
MDSYQYDMFDDQTDDHYTRSSQYLIHNEYSIEEEGFDSNGVEIVPEK